MVRSGEVWHGGAWLGEARRGEARQGKDFHGRQTTTQRNMEHHPRAYLGARQRRMPALQRVRSS